MWAEDGTVFFKGAIEAGWRAILEPYAGQLFLFQRGVAFLVAPLPTLYQPALYAASSILAALASAAILLSSRWRRPVPLTVRFVCLLALLCSPQVDDSFATLTNAHWWLAIGLLLLGMLADPPGRLSKTGEVAFTIVASLSGFAALYGLPMLGVRAIRNRSPHSIAILVVAASGLLVQVFTMLASNRHGNIDEIVTRPATAVLVLVKKILVTDIVGPTNLAALSPAGSIGWRVGFLGIALAGALGVVWVRAIRNDDTRLEAGALGVTFLGGWFLALWALTLPGLDLDMLFWPGAATRYFVAPTAVFYLLLLLWEPGGSLARIALGVACLLLAAGILSGYRLDGLTRVDWAPFATCVDKTNAVCSVAIPPGWQLEVNARARPGPVSP